MRNENELNQSANKYFVSEDTVVFNERTKVIESLTLHDMANIRHVILPEGVEKIKDRAFFNVGITEVTLPSSVQEVGKWAFAYCKCLKKVTILCEKAALHPRPFFECDAIEDVICKEDLRYDQRLHLVGHHFLQKHVEDEANLNHSSNKEFVLLSRLCGEGNADAMNQFSLFFDAFSKQIGASPFYFRASNYWRYRAYREGNKEATEWFDRWFLEHPNLRMESILPENTNDRMSCFSYDISGTILNDLGFGFFDPKRIYCYRHMEGDPIVEVSTNDKPDTSFCEDYRWYYLDEYMCPLHGVSNLYGEIGDTDDDQFRETREKARMLAKERKSLGLSSTRKDLF